jgi:hypothetical protein
MKYRTRKFIAGMVLLIVTIAIYYAAVPIGTMWLGKDGHLFNLSLGLISGLVVLLFQFAVDNLRDKELEELQETKIVRVLRTRDDEDYYRNILKKTRTSVSLMGVTGSRFLEHFADTEHPDEKKRVLIKLITERVKIRFLLASEQNLSSTNKANFNKTKSLLKNLLTATNANAFEVRYYQHDPIISMVIADEDCLVGPVFPETSSKHTTTIHAKSNGNWAEGHIKYFEDEWIKATNP